MPLKCPQYLAPIYPPSSLFSDHDSLVIAKPIEDRHNLSMRIIVTLLTWFFGIMALVAVFSDLTDGRSGIIDVGGLWFEMAPSSLQISEAIISRYIDPCGLFISLDCAPFLWHPVISFFLLLPAAPFFIVMTALVIVLRKMRNHRGNKAKPRKSANKAATTQINE